MSTPRSTVFRSRNLLACLGLVLGLVGLNGTARAQVPVITATSAARQVVTINQNLALTVAATGATGFQWRHNGLAIAGATNANYTITGAIPYRDNGWYQAVATNASGATTSGVVFVNVAVSPAWVFSLPYNEFGTTSPPPSGVSSVVAVAAGNDHSLALKSDGTVIGWGGNNYGQTTIPHGLSGVVAVAAGGDHSLAVKSDGTVVGWGGDRFYGAATIPDGLSGVIAVAAGNSQSIALKSDGTVVGWGRTRLGQTTIPSGLRGVTAIAGGSSNALYLRNATGDLAPTITTQHSARTARVGEINVTLNVTAVGTPPFSYQWLKDGVAIPGANSPSYTQLNVPVSAAGVYSVTVANAIGAVTSPVTTLAMTTSRFTNVSVRSVAGTGDSTLIVGLVLGGWGSKQMLLRGIGPGLRQFGLTGALADPQLRLFNSAGVQTDENDDWGGGAVLASAFEGVGAFPLPTSPKDAALFLPLASGWFGSYTAQVTSAAGTGTALVEAYDADAAGFTARLSNLSARTRVGTGENILIVGFAIAGNLPMNVLIRAVGPGLAQFGVGGVLADPQLSVVKSDSSVAMAVSDNWGGSPALTAAFTATGAFPLPSASQDAALLVALPPGVYTAQVSGVGGTTGVALVEIYELP